MRRTDPDARAPLARPAAVADDDLPRGWTVAGVIAQLEPMALPRRLERITRVLEQRSQSVSVLLDGTHDPHNTAAVFRSCDAFGVQDVHLVRRDEPFLTSQRISKGTDRWLDVLEHSDANAAIDELRTRDFELVATHPEGELLPEDLAGIARVALVFGNEATGIGDELRGAARRSVRIPMRGFVESLNVSVSAAILLTAAMRDRPGDLPLERRQLLLARALFRSVPRADEILAALPAR